MEYPQYPYQRQPYTYRQVPYLPVAHYDVGWGNGATAAGFTPYPDYYVAPVVGPIRSPKPRGRQAIPPEQKLRYLKHRLIKDEPADRHLRQSSGPGRPPHATPASKTLSPAVVAPEVLLAEALPPPPPPPPPAIPIPNSEPEEIPLPQEETATEITPTRELHYPAKLHRERTQKLHAWNDKASHSAWTVFVIVHEFDGSIVDVQVSNTLKDAIDEVLRVMARYHPRTFKSTPLRRALNAPAAANSDESAAKKDGGDVKDEDEDVNANSGGDDGNKGEAEAAESPEPERERRFVYKGDWKFTHASTLKLEARLGKSFMRVSCSLKNMRHEKNESKKGKEKKGGGSTDARLRRVFLEG
ncbi:hypothetical protein PG985_003868 [Apiospora marii]|uniref:Uncharacterized protein n=1 Tax=Apiospora marii TaxID=335849 RepID=A0ABR1SI53_9PEZI